MDILRTGYAFYRGNRNLFKDLGMIRVYFKHPLVFIQDGMLQEAMFIDCLFIETDEDAVLKMYAHPSDEALSVSLMNVEKLKPQPCI